MIVTARLNQPGRRVIGIDLAPKMASIAAARLPGQIALGDVARLPVADESMNAAVMIWLLHLMNDIASAAALAEAARILQPGGVLLTTVDKNDANFAVDSDTVDLINPVRAAYAPPQSGCCCADQAAPEVPAFRASRRGRPSAGWVGAACPKAGARRSHACGPCGPHPLFGRPCGPSSGRLDPVGKVLADWPATTAVLLREGSER
jgi:SAM-dependent methyltransferase